MDKSGQMTFSDDPLLHGANEAYQFIRSGEFARAVEKLNELMNVDPNYPGIVDAYRTAKFWLNREDHLKRLGEGKETADFLMKQWNEFEEYASSKKLHSSSAFDAAMRYIFFRASQNYKTAFAKQEDTSGNFDLLLNLGSCFLRLEEYKSTIDALEYARSSYRSSARLLAILGEAYFHTDDIPKSLLYFREAFFVDPTEIDLGLIKAKPVHELAELIHHERGEAPDVREWIPVYGFLRDIFYVRRNLNRHQVDGIQNEIYTLEVNYKKIAKDQMHSSNILPRLINKYLWMLDYYEFQNYNFENISQIRDRLIQIDKNLFQEYFKNKKQKQ